VEEPRLKSLGFTPWVSPQTPVWLGKLLNLSLYW